MSDSSHENLHGHHGFLMLGTKNLYLCHLPMYSMPAHSFKTILEAEIEEPAMEKFLRIKKENPRDPLLF